MRKIVVTTPIGAKNLAEIVNVLYGGRGEAITKKQVIVCAVFADKHFDFLPDEQRKKVVAEWSGTTVTAFLVEDIAPESRKKLREIAYLTPEGDEKRAERDVLLWFPEHVIE